ncbi:MAG: Fe(3+) ABC transporter substrate-binding protein [Beijerinckiaceae bacterium]|jgi:iron(III) transport system substrate-binding protein|nr:Fe(3+) ABC transporter substrate-binding protein [Beijerinckiaceae bacterium]
MNRLTRRPILPALLALALAGPAFAQGEVNLYTHREPGLIKPLLDKFTAETGVKVNVVFAANGLAERIQSEGERSPADLLLSVDIATLNQAIALGVTQPVTSPALEKAVPAHLRGTNNGWWGVSQRVRAYYVSKDRVKDTALTYEDLATPRFKGRVCSRDGLHPYNTSLISAVIAHNGEAGAEAWLKGVRANLAKKPSGGDRDVAKDIAAGICDIGPANTYYMGLMQKDPAQKAWAEAVRVILPTFKDGGGTHVNISGVVFARHAKNKANALRLVEWLVGPEAQAIYAEQNHEYPVVSGIEPNAFLKSLGTLKADTTPLETIGKNRKAASELVDKVGFNLGPQS